MTCRGITRYLTANPKERATDSLSLFKTSGSPANLCGLKKMKIKNSLKALMTRHRDNRLVRRKGRVYIINKMNPRFKARQG